MAAVKNSTIRELADLLASKSVRPIWDDRPPSVEHLHGAQRWKFKRVPVVMCFGPEETGDCFEDWGDPEFEVSR